MRFGIITPIVTLGPRTHAAWEEGAGREELREIAILADRLGFHHLTCSEHVAIPVEVAAVRGGRYYDPAATLGFFAALTQRIRLLSHVVVLPYHHPLTLAKRFGTLDRLSGGRAIVGVGVGSLEQEFDLLGVDFATRGPRYEDALRALRAALGKQQPEYTGTHYQFRDLLVDPAALQPRLPIWIGGRSARSLRRALVFADGWDPFGLTNTQLDDLLRRAHDWPEWQRDGAFDLVLSPEEPLVINGRADLERIRDCVASYRRLGATVLNLRFRQRNLRQYLDALALFADEVMPEFQE
jgi:probable F420-dependent oxidoreductase